MRKRIGCDVNFLQFCVVIAMATTMFEGVHVAVQSCEENLPPKLEGVLTKFIQDPTGSTIPIDPWL